MAHGGSGEDNPVALNVAPMEEIRVVLSWDSGTGEVIRRIGSRTPRSDDELGNLLADFTAAFRRIGKRETPVLIDAEPAVPWKDVIRVMDLCKVRGLTRVELATPMPN